MYICLFYSSERASTGWIIVVLMAGIQAAKTTNTKITRKDRIKNLANMESESKGPVCNMGRMLSVMRLVNAKLMNDKTTASLKTNENTCIRLNPIARSIPYLILSRDISLQKSPNIEKKA